MLRVNQLMKDRLATSGSLFSPRELTELLLACANGALVTASRPPMIAVIASFAALLLSVTALSSGVQAPDSRSFTISLPGSKPSVLHIRAGTLFHTLDSDFFPEDDQTTYVQTGDIPAMWLRDSSAQTLPYVRFASAVPAFQPIVRAVIERNAKNVLTEPYANAFTSGYKVWEEKWEPDSLAYPITLVYAYWQQTNDRSVFTPRLRWSLEHTLATFECEQHHDTCSGYRSRFLTNHGRGADFSDTGMIWGAFRPSDDPVRYPFNVPQNMLVSVALQEISELAARGFGDRNLSQRAGQIAAQVRDGIERYGKVYDFHFGWIYAYEVDGRGNSRLMDDANMPNLISATYFDYVSPVDPVYQNTRRFALSGDDPFYYQGRYASGLGSPHTPTGWIWPLGMIAQALTASNADETTNLVKSVEATSGSEELIHESFDPDNPSRFTRPNFGWANAMYAELLFRSIAGMSPEPLTHEWLPQLFPLDCRTPKIASFVEQLQNEGTVTQALRQSCGSSIPLCYVR